MPSIVRGQWTAYGATGADAALFRTATPPVDPYATLQRGLGTAFACPSNTTMRDCQSNSNSGPEALWAFAVGGAFDTDRERWIGTQATGHSSVGTNEVNEFICSTGTWTRVMNPTLELFTRTGVQIDGVIAYANVHNSGPLGLIDWANRYPANVLPATSSGLKVYPNTAQTYGSVCYMPAPYNALFTQGGVANYDPNFACSEIFVWYTATSQWEMEDKEFAPNGRYPGGSGFPGGACWDSTNSRVLWNDLRQIWAYYPGRATSDRVFNIYGDNGFNQDNDENTALWDSVRKRLWLFGGKRQRYYDFSGGPFSPTEVVFTLTGTDTPQTGQGQGWLYDPVIDRFIHMPMTNPNNPDFNGYNLVSMDPTVPGPNFPCTLITVSTAGVQPTTSRMGGDTSPTAQGSGMWTRFFYSKNLDAYFALPRAQDSTVYAYGPVRSVAPPTGSPCVDFIDLTQGPATGNPDTSFGQTANVDGAYVTVWGQNLGTTQGTSTVTLGGIAQTVIAWGAAQPPLCPANLVNGYQNYQCVIFQVNHATPAGAQNLFLTVGGVSTAQAVTFTVAAGNIRFVDGSTIFTVVPNMASGDITYINNNVSVPGGVPAPAGAASASAPLAIGAAPNAVVTIGSNNVNPAWPVNTSGSGRMTTYFKMNLRGGTPSGGPGSQLVGLGLQTRVVGNNIQCPNGNGSSGTLGVDPFQRVPNNTIRIFGNEFTNCGQSPSDPQYHVVYLSGWRFVSPLSSMIVESDREVAYNYFHNNSAVRAINIFNNAEPTQPGCNPIADHRVHHNYIAHQAWAAIGFLDGVVGTNVAHDNLIIDAGRTDTSVDPVNTPGIGVSFEWAPGTPPDYPPGPQAITLKGYNNTVIHSSDPGLAVDRGVFEFRNKSRFTLQLWNNLIFQDNGVSYTSPNSNPTVVQDPTNISNNLWFGAGPPPAFDTNPINTNPNLVLETAPYDGHLLNNSPAIHAGVNLS